MVKKNHADIIMYFGGMNIIKRSEAALFRACLLPYAILFFVHNKKKVYIFKKKINEYTRTVATTIEIIYFNGGCISIVGETVRPYNV